jgi:hypothetical protein
MADIKNHEILRLAALSRRDLQRSKETSGLL